MSVSEGTRTAQPEARPAVEPWWDRASPWWWVAIFTAVLIAYWPVLHAGFIWDDAGHVTRPDLRPLAGLGRIWFQLGATQQYYPVLHSAFWFEWHLWGGAAVGYHLLNILLHATSACLFAVILRRLRVPGAWLAATLFALHPVAVESVAWVAEQKNTLSTVFYLCSALAYLRFDVRRRGRDYALAAVLFVLALGTKTVSATLPAALLVVFWWRRGRLDWRRDVLPLLPWFAAGVAAGLTTSWVEHTMIGAAGADFRLSPLDRCLLAGRVFWFYLGKLLWPADLMFVYPRWSIDSGAAWQYLFPLTAVALLVACRLARRRGLLAGLLLFGGTLFPALGFVNVYPFIFSYVADHFQYLADFGFWALVGVGAATWFTRAPRTMGVTATAMVAVSLGVLTHRQTRMYHDEVTLYRTTLARNPDAWMAHNNLGIALVNAGRGAEAIAHYEAALKIHPDFPEGENNLGYDLTLLGRPAEALPHFDRALQLQPDYAEAHNNRGIALMKLGRAAEGEAEFRRALQLKPAYPEAHFNLGLALAHSGRTAAALKEFAAAVRLRPDYTDAELNWAIGLTLSGQFPAAFAHFRRAVQLSPNQADVHVMFGRALARAGRLNEAVEQFRAAIALDPSDGNTHLHLAIALRELGRNADADRELQQAAQLGAQPPG